MIKNFLELYGGTALEFLLGAEPGMQAKLTYQKGKLLVPAIKRVADWEVIPIATIRWTDSSWIQLQFRAGKLQLIWKRSDKKGIQMCREGEADWPSWIKQLEAESL
jgi:hypothetical protein